MSEQIINKNYDLIERFTHHALNKKFKSMLELKKVHKLCRVFIEKALSQDSDLQSLLPQEIEQGLLMKELIVNYTLLKMHHHAALWEMIAHNPERGALSEEDKTIN